MVLGFCLRLRVLQSCPLGPPKPSTSSLPPGSACSQDKTETLWGAMQTLRSWPGMCPPSRPSPPLPPSLHIYSQPWPCTQQQGPLRCAGASHPQAMCHQGGGPKGWVGGHHAEGLVGQLSAHVRTVHAQVQGEQTVLPSFTPMPPELTGLKGGRAPRRHARRRASTPGSQRVASNRRRQGWATQICWTVPSTTSTVPCSMPSEKPGGLLLRGQPLRPGISDEPFPEPPGPWDDPTEQPERGLNPLNIKMWTPSA